MNAKQAKQVRAKTKQHVSRISRDAMNSLMEEIEQVYSELGFWDKLKLCFALITGKSLIPSMMRISKVAS